MKLKIILLLELFTLILYVGNVWIGWLFPIRILILWIFLKPVRPSLEPAPDPKEEIKYLALQNQINPHFLYNTLEGLRSEALIEGLDSVATMSELLARFFRYNISNLSQMVTIEEELANLETYFQIQQFRFEDRIKLQTIFENDKDRILSRPVPKLLLQPIVENAIQHGLEPLTRQGTITLRFQIYEGLFVIIISDDGIGMTSHQLELLNEKMKGGTDSIGIANVNQRIQLLFGQEYGLRFYSKEGHGTDVEVTLPSKKGAFS